MSITIPFNDYPTLICALETWGAEEQFGMANEEFSECIAAMNQFKRGRIDKAKLATEIADAFIMANQLAIIAGESEVQEQIEYKLRRLKERLLNLSPDQSKAWFEEYAAIKSLKVKAVEVDGGIAISGLLPELLQVQPEDPQPV